MDNDAQSQQLIANALADNFQRFLETGVWWEDEWWLGETYLAECPEEEIRKNIDALKRHFTSEWVLRALADKKFPNAVLSTLSGGQGFGPFWSLMVNGQMLWALSQAEGLSRKVEELRAEKSISTHFEMQIASRFALAGYKVNFVSENTKLKSQDIDAVLGDFKFAIECKRLEPLAWEEWGDTLTHDLMHIITDSNVPNELRVQIELDPGLSVLRMEGEGEESFTKAIVEGIYREVRTSIKALVIEPGEKRIPGVAKIRVLPLAAGNQGYISGFPISPHAKMRHILQKGIFRALKQLPTERPGVIAMFCNFPPMPELIKLVLDSGIAAEKARFSHLAGIVLFPKQALNTAFPQLLYLNQNSDVPARDLEELARVFETTTPNLELVN